MKVEQLRTVATDHRVLPTTFMIVSQVSFPLVLEANKRFTGKFIDSSLMILGVETFKAAVCGIALIVKRCKYDVFDQQYAFDKQLCLKLSIPALIYYGNNNLSFVIMRLISSAEYLVLQQLKILTTALCVYVSLGKPLSIQQWIALSLLTCACAGSQITESGFSFSKDWKDGVFKNCSGALLTVLQTLLSAFASVYTEKLLKGHKQHILLQNIQLYSWGVLCGVARLMFLHVDLQAFMQAVTVYHVAAFSLLSSTGIAVSFVMKYADNIVKVLGSAISMFLATGASALLFGTPPSSQFIACLLAAACAIAMYNIPLSQMWNRK